MQSSVASRGPDVRRRPLVHARLASRSLPAARCAYTWCSGSLCARRESAAPGRIKKDDRACGGTSASARRLINKGSRSCKNFKTQVTVQVDNWRHRDSSVACLAHHWAARSAAASVDCSAIRTGRPDRPDRRRHRRLAAAVRRRSGVAGLRAAGAATAADAAAAATAATARWASNSRPGLVRQPDLASVGRARRRRASAACSAMPTSAPTIGGVGRPAGQAAAVQRRPGCGGLCTATAAGPATAQQRSSCRRKAASAT